MAGLDIDFSKTKRLVVLIPPETTQETHLAATIWRQASPCGMDVLYLSIANDYEDEMDLRRRLTTLAAITRDSHVRVETKLINTSNWLKAIKATAQPGDTLIVHSEQIITKGLFGTQPLAGYIAKNTATPVSTLSGYSTGTPRHDPRVLHWVLAIFFLVLIFGGSFLLDSEIIRQMTGVMQQVALAIMIAFEIGLIWVWNAWEKADRLRT